MMKSVEFENIIALVICIICQAKGDVSQQPTVLPTSTSTPLPVLKTTTAFTQTYMTVNFNTNTEQPEVPPTQNPGSRLDLPSSNLTPLSHHPETSPVPQQPQSANSEISDASKETNSINDIFTEDEKLFNINERTISPEVENHKTIPSVTPEQTESQGTPHKETDAFLEGTLEDGDKDGSFGLAPWKIGVISAAVFLATEAIVLTIYCLICRKRSRDILAINCEQDSEAGETIHVESNGNTEMGEERTVNGVPAHNASDYGKPIELQDAQQESDEKQIILDKKFTDV